MVIACIKMQTKMKISNQLSLWIIFCKNTLNLLSIWKTKRLFPSNGFILFFANIYLLWTLVDCLFIFEFKIFKSISLMSETLLLRLIPYLFFVNLFAKDRFILSIMFSCLICYSSSSASHSSKTLIWIAKNMFIKKNWPIIIKGVKYRTETWF